jgi:molybdenum cofactor cytidylyltransferase
MISGILLAAGKSERMGSFKQLLAINGKSFVECCVDNLAAAGLDEIVVVTGHNEAAVRGVLEGRNVRFAHNPEYERGMASSIICGFRGISPRSDAVVIALVDQPLVQPATIHQLILAYEAERPAIIVPTHQGKNGHPIVISITLAEAVLAMDIDVGLREVLRIHQHQIKHVEVESPAILIDFDYPEDYKSTAERER